MTTNNALERQRMIGGRPVLAVDCALAGAKLASCLAAERYR
jgi:hypothetical protein